MEQFERSEHVPFNMLIDRNADRVLVALTGEFSLDAGRRFEEGLREVERAPVRTLIIDLSGVTMMDSTATLQLLELYHRFRAHATVVFEGGSQRVRGLLSAAGVESTMGEDPEHLPRHPPHIGPGIPMPELPPLRPKL